VPEPPAATSSPSVGGTPRRGTTLVARTGVWNNAPTGFTYQWQRLMAAGWEDIDDETTASYLVTSEDLGRRLRVAVIASNPDGSASAASAPTAPIGASAVNRAASKSSKGSKSSRAKSAVKAKTSAKKAKAKKAKAKKAKAAKAKKAKAKKAKAAKAKKAKAKKKSQKANRR
jgi:hypothetical protein